MNTETGLTYLMRNDMNDELDELITKRFKLIQSFDGQVCKKCRVIEGKPLKGFRKYYCKHLSRRIDRMLREDKNRAIKRLGDFISVKMSEKHSEGFK